MNDEISLSGETSLSGINGFKMSKLRQLEIDFGKVNKNEKDDENVPEGWSTGRSDDIVSGGWKHDKIVVRKVPVKRKLNRKQLKKVWKYKTLSMKPSKLS